VRGPRELDNKGSESERQPPRGAPDGTTGPAKSAMSQLDCADGFLRLPRVRAELRRHPMIALLVVLLLLGAIPPLLSAFHPERRSIPRPSHVNPRYATQSGSLYLTRRRQVEQQNEEHLDSALEACAGVGLGRLAARYHLPQDPVRVARRFAAAYERAYRRHAYEGCLHGLKEGG
jgi:hypothetical protein